jgi:hypothetical protein
MKNLVATLGLTLLSTMAFAAADPTRSLDATDAAAIVQNYKTVLSVPGCPGAQTAVSGMVVGGASPLGGSQTTTITLSGGATFVVTTTWSNPIGDGSYGKSTTTVKCSL